MQPVEIVSLEELQKFAENVLDISKTKVSGMDISNQYLKMTGPFARGLELVISGHVALGTSVVNKNRNELCTFVFIQDERSHRAVSRKIPVVINSVEYKTNIRSAVNQLKEDKEKGLISSTFNRKSENKLIEIFEIPMFYFDPFLQSLAKAVRTFGSLTPKQEMALQDVKDKYTPKVSLNDAQEKFLKKLQKLPSHNMIKKEKQIVCSVYAKACRGQKWNEDDRTNILAIINEHT